jgi:hypothetical protein
MASKVSMTALRFALTRIAEEVCRSPAILIRVAEAPFQPHSFYAVSIPFEVRAELCHYLAERVDLSFPPDGGPLILTFQQAGAVVDLAYRKEAGWASADKPEAVAG